MKLSNKMKCLIATAVSVCFLNTASASIETKDWHNIASPKAQQFMQDNMAVDFYAAPFGTGWDQNREVTNYIDLAHSRGISGASITLGSPATPNWAKYKAELAKWTEAVQESNAKIRFVKEPEDFVKAQQNGEYAVMWNSQTTMMLEGDVSRVKEMADDGIKVMQLVYNGVELTGVGGVSALTGDKSGLTQYGKEVIDEMVKHGITVDMSHHGYQTTVDITDYMKDKHPGVPAIYSHSPLASTYGCEPHETLTETEKRMAEKGYKKGDPFYRLSACYRLISDEQALTVKEMGGMISITATEWMMDGVWPEDITPKQFAEMIDGAVKVVGIEHVGIGTDDMMTTSKVVGFAKANADVYTDNGYMIDAFNRGATGCAEMSKHLAAVIDELWKMGYSNEDMRKIMGENLVRVYKKSWK
ncbi:membrane dipeptidase [Thalassotalea psychrophila]|uniref:Membrane dipeptidase n=1 Tax=Thalassotalea psychrophila TaxID=3065647 RepID=A0ABY9TXW2_9GAMM|nr:membrane dipeptidase [Colwelliaceae bacterium SQ149]